MERKLISIVSGCYNEEDNLQEFYDRVIGTLSRFPHYSYEIIMADNCSTDGSRDILRRLAAQDPNFKVIMNANNFGPIRSGYHAFLQASGDAVVLMSSDLQDPPELIADFLGKWEQSFPVVVASKNSSGENSLVFFLRSLYYRLLTVFSKSEGIIQNFTGFGLYDRKFMNALKRFPDPNPYFRGLVSEIGFRRAVIHFDQPPRKHGQSKHDLFTYYDFAMSGFVNHSILPLRLATFSGFCLAGLSLVVAVIYLVYKLLYWNTFTLGLAPLVVGLFFFSAVQLIFIGIIGEYVGAILTQVKMHPLVIEEEKINFADKERNS
ncbi:MAG: glycosyltransferase family 2 protein [Candidatus Riflebacteria bacterium]|nr:glycosyltransferase family 2 protein [Candidatus Riflebacteria bacterium]